MEMEPLFGTAYRHRSGPVELVAVIQTFEIHIVNHAILVKIDPDRIRGIGIPVACRGVKVDMFPGGKSSHQTVQRIIIVTDRIADAVTDVVDRNYFGSRQIAMGLTGGRSHLVERHVADGFDLLRCQIGCHRPRPGYGYFGCDKGKDRPNRHDGRTQNRRRYQNFEDGKASFPSLAKRVRPARRSISEGGVIFVFYMGEHVSTRFV
jgi:hypothetical protein